MLRFNGMGSSVNHVLKVWQELVAVEEFLTDELPKILNEGGIVSPADWRVIHDAVGTIRSERLFLPSEFYSYIDTCILPKLEGDINSLLNTMTRGATALKTAEESGSKIDVSGFMSEANISLNSLHDSYVRHLQFLRSSFSKEIEGQKVPPNSIDAINESSTRHTKESTDPYIHVEVKMSNNDGDTYNVQQAGAVGRHARSDFNTFVSSPEKRTLAEAAKEIQDLLKNLEETSPSATEDEKIVYINDETTPSFKRRVAGALQASGETVIDEFILENKYLKVAKAAVKGWLQPGS
jgi:hypothetical protein